MSIAGIIVMSFMTLFALLGVGLSLGQHYQWKQIEPLLRWSLISVCVAGILFLFIGGWLSALGLLN